MGNLKVTNTALKDVIMELMNLQYVPGKQYLLALVCTPIAE